MAESGGSPSFGSIPLGVLELNTFIAGIEAIPWLLVLRALFGWQLPEIPRTWEVVVIAVLGLSVLGLALEGMAGILERLVTRKGNVCERVFLYGKGERVLDWYATLTKHPADWTNAQRWIWTSPQAAAEYGRRRLRILVARNTTFNVLVLTVVASVLVGRRSGLLLGLAPLVGGAVLTGLFGFVWLDANRAYHQAVADAGAVDRK